MKFFLLIGMMALMAWTAQALPLAIKTQNAVLSVPTMEYEGQLFSLQGDWQFFANKVLAPEQDCPQGEGRRLDIMSYWLLEVLVQNPSWRGLSSFCLEIDNPDGRAISLWWPERIGLDVYANGRLVFGKGQLRNGRTELYYDRQTGLIVLPSDRHIRLLVHATNEFMNWRRLREGLYFGETASLIRQQNLKLIFDMFALSTLLMTGFYQFALFFIHRDRRETLLLGLFCVSLSIRFGSLGSSNVLSILKPDFLGLWTYSLGYWGYFFGVALFYHFLRINYPDLFYRWMMQTLWALSVFFSALCLYFGSSVYAASLPVFHGFAGIAIITSMFGIVRAVKQRRRGAVALAVGTVMLSLTSLHDMLRSQGYGLDYDSIVAGQLVFVASASVLVSIRFSHAFRTVSHLSRELSKIVPQHVITLLSNGTQLEQCMPVGEQDAVVLVFDVVGSSKISDPLFRKALDLCMARFFEAMNVGYDPERLEATGYRIKEMGDGLICTLGFPFKVPQGEQMDALALLLAEKMCQIFHEEMQLIQSPSPMLCGIGLARGPVEGFFPQAGQKQYDLRGQPLTLATRYESMRNSVYQRFGRQGSVIFIQDAVYQHLTQEQKQSLQEWDASHPDQHIRDDDEARRAWFKFVPHPKTRRDIRSA